MASTGQPAINDLPILDISLLVKKQQMTKANAEQRKRNNKTLEVIIH